MLKVNNLSVSFGEKQILRGVNLELPQPGILAIVGESGTGKTTLGLSLMGLLPQVSSQAVVSGEIRLEGQDILQLSGDELSLLRWTRVSMVFQQVEKALNPVMTVMDQVIEPLLKKKGCQHNRAREQSLAVLKRVGLQEQRHLFFPHQLSRGERQLALLAMALVCDPPFVILDEPTSALDTVAKRRIIELIRQIGQERSVLLISHDLSLVAGISCSVAVLYGGMIIETAGSKSWLAEPRHPYSRGLIRSFPDMIRGKDLLGLKGTATDSNGGCPFQPRCTQSIAVCSSRRPELTRLQDRRLACHRQGIVPLLAVHALTKSFGIEPVIRSLTFKLLEGETLAVIGPSGSGKTTLARIIFGQLPADKGSISLSGEVIRKWDREFYQQVQLIDQNPAEAVSHRLTVAEAVGEPLDILREGNRPERLERVKMALQEVQLPFSREFLDRYPRQLSGGELQRLVIARALILGPKLLIADEPTSSLDCSIQAKIVRLLHHIQETRGVAILLITHDIALARKMSDRLAVLQAGQIIEQGNASDILAIPAHCFTRQMIDAAGGSLLEGQSAAAARRE